MLLEAEVWLTLVEILSFLLWGLSESQRTQENQPYGFSFQESLMSLSKEILISA